MELKNAVKDPKNAKKVVKDAMKLLNDGVCVKTCPEKLEDKVECVPTKRMLALPKYKNGSKTEEREYFENCVYYADPADMAKLLGDDAANAIRTAGVKG
jgi:hypothetical protein